MPKLKIDNDEIAEIDQESADKLLAAANPQIGKATAPDSFPSKVFEGTWEAPVSITLKVDFPPRPRRP